MDKQNNNHEFEYQRLEKVLDIIEKKQNALKEQSSKVKEDVVELRKTFGMILQSTWMRWMISLKHRKALNSNRISLPKKNGIMGKIING